MAALETCGQGLASHSTLPTTLAELTAATAEVLEVHTTALDLDDENARRERDVYVKLVEMHREAAGQLLAIGEEMASHRDLPMATHDPEVMSSSEPADAFAKLVEIEQELLAMLRERVEQGRAMLDELGRD